MKYIEYIQLGFKRIDMNDPVEMDRSGYPGYALVKKINDRVSIEVYGCELNTPKLYIRKKNSDTNHIINLTPDAVKDLLYVEPKENSNRVSFEIKNTSDNYIFKAC